MVTNLRYRRWQQCNFLNKHDFIDIPKAEHIQHLQLNKFTDEYTAMKPSLQSMPQTYVSPGKVSSHPLY
jgi:hypothetical protein